MAKPYKEGIGWCVRSTYKGHDIYLSGKPSAREAEREMAAEKVAIDKNGAPSHGGPKKKSLAQAMQQYGIEVLPTLKGAPQLVRRINRYLIRFGLRPGGREPEAAEPLPARTRAVHPAPGGCR